MIDACAKLSERHAFVAHRDFPAEVCKRCGIEHALSGQALLHSGIAGRRRREDDFGFFDPPHALRQHRVDTAGRKLRELGKEKVFPAAALNPARQIEVRTEFSKKRVIRRQKLQGLTNNAVGAGRNPIGAIPVGERERFTLARTLPRGRLSVSFSAPFSSTPVRRSLAGSAAPAMGSAKNPAKTFFRSGSDATLGANPSPVSVLRTRRPTR